MPWELIITAVTAGLLASLACGVGVLPLFISKLDPKEHTGIAYAFAGGLMFSASVYNLIAPGFQMAGEDMQTNAVLLVLGGIISGALFLHGADWMLDKHRPSEKFALGWGGRMGMLIFVVMTIHSMPEGVAVGVGFTSGEVYETKIGIYLALAIGIHNIPEGLAVAIPMRAAGASFNKCFWSAVITSLPQPIAAIPAVLVSWFFTPIMPILMGFAAGSMIFLILLELLPDALSREKPYRVAWAFTIGFCLMLLIQILL